MKNAQEKSLEGLKRKLATYTKKDIQFNEPHFTQQMIMREGKKKEVIYHLLNPEKLVYAYKQEGKYGDTVHSLHFKVNEVRTLRLPVIFDRNNKKSLYILTYIMRYRSWQNMIKKKDEY